MKITILCVGKIRESYWEAAIAEYMKRLTRYCKPEIVQVADEKTPDDASDNLNRQILEKEGDRLLAKLPDDAYVITLEIGGTPLSSVAFSEKIQKLGVAGVSHICFVIGGSLGLDPRVSKQADFKLSFSAMTFPHQLMRVILSEQIYRAYRIISGEPYHK
ncbi:MAG: 23S rRNA (pseudouridine(1915)-N(3))-methyltransferase RlmH [Lachnospiraceae bacterium]|nr:23S rRNA (pseudouridine(1915)-N(3))-methyltransferase RlmH [Lachnospiraceae bacterium]